MYVRPGNGWKPHQNLHIYGKIDVNGDNQHPLYEFLKVILMLLLPGDGLVRRHLDPYLENAYPWETGWMKSEKPVDKWRKQLRVYP